MRGDPTLIDGRYRLDVELGAGAFGQVFKAIQVVFGKDMRTVALKLFSGGALRAENIEEMMTDALAILNLMGNLSDWEIRQHFVTVYDLGVTEEERPRGFVAMELVPGGSLERRLRDFEKFTLQGTFHYTHQIARAMAFMHQEGYVHSDLKPANVLVFQGRGRDVVKIGDFGLAGRYLGPFGKGPRGGTLSYLPYEALQGLPTTPAGDVFAMGVIAYEMITGANPYNRVGTTLDPKRHDHSEVLSQMQADARTSPLVLRREDFPELSSSSRALGPLVAFLDVVNKMLACLPADRYASARDVLRELNRINESLPEANDRSAPAAIMANLDAAAAPVRGFGDETDRDFETFLTSRDWPAAQRRASEVIKRAPSRALGYLLKSRVASAQAEYVTHDGVIDAAAITYLKGAVPPLQRGLDACTSVDDRQVLRSALASAYQKMGDHETARYYLNRES